MPAAFPATLLEKINASSLVSDFIYQLEFYQFILLDSKLSFMPQRVNDLIVLYKYNNPIVNVPITSDHSMELITGNMHSLYSLGNNFGYLFKFANFPYYRGPGYFGVTQRKDILHQGVEVKLKSQNLYLFESDCATLCIGKMNECYVENFGFYRSRKEEG